MGIFKKKKKEWFYNSCFSHFPFSLQVHFCGKCRMCLSFCHKHVYVRRSTSSFFPFCKGSTRIFAGTRLTKILPTNSCLRYRSHFFLLAVEVSNCGMVFSPVKTVSLPCPASGDKVLSWCAVFAFPLKEYLWPWLDSSLITAESGGPCGCVTVLDMDTWATLQVDTAMDCSKRVLC